MNVTTGLFDLRPALDEQLTDKAKMLVADVLANQSLARATEFGGLLARLGEDRGVFGMAVLGHAVEMDDMHRLSSTHPGPAAVASALHAAAHGGKGGRAVLEGLAFGVEVIVRIARALGGPALYERGYHPSSYCAAFGAAAASALLLDLSRDQFCDALGLAGCQAAGLMCGVEEGPSSWYVQYGRGAAAGADAARLAAAGVSGPSDVLGGSRGLLEVFGREAAADELLAPGTVGLPELSFKLHACLFFGQAAVEATLEALGHTRWQDVERADLFIPEQAYSVRDFESYPQTRLAAQSDLRYLVAIALRFGRVTLAEFTPDVQRSLDVKELWQRVRVAGRKNLSALYPERWPAEVRLHLRDGRALGAKVVSAKGAPERPLTWDELQAKAGLPEEVLELVRRLDKLDDVRPLLEI